MSNMSYCRFQNTSEDLRDCFENWEEVKSEDEKRAQKRLLELCKGIVESYGEED